MIELTQRNSLNDFENGNKLDVNDIISIHFSKDIINKDIDRLTQMKENYKNGNDKTNIKILIEYLKNILKKLDDNNSMEICWTEDSNGIVKTYPVSILKEKAYGINSCNYIELDDKQKLVEIDMTELADIIAFEFMYKDMCETHDSIEDLLKDCGIIGYEKSDILTNFFKENGDDVFELSRSYLIGETPYSSYEDETVIDYFHTKKFKSKKYKEVVEYSCKYANFIIMNRFIKNATTAKLDIKPIMLTPTCIAFLLNNVDDNIDVYKSIVEDVSIRAFGRKFIVKPNVSVV